MLNVRDDRYWSHAAAFVKNTGCEAHAVIAPREFGQLVPGIVSYEERARCTAPKLIVLHKGLLEELGREWIEAMAKTLYAAFGNEVFVIFSANRPAHRIGYPSHFRAFVHDLRKRNGSSGIAVETSQRSEASESKGSSFSLRWLKTWFAALHERLFADPYGPLPLIFRVLAEHGRAHWRSYALAYILMGVTAGCMALAAYIIGHVVNETLLSRNFTGILALCAVTILVYGLKGLAFYGYTIVLAYISSSITAENTQRMFAKLIDESLAYFASRPSSGMMAQVTYGAAAAPTVLNLLVTAAGRDALTLIGLTAVMILQDPLMSMIGLVVMPPAVLLLRTLRARVRTLALTQFGGGAALMEAIQEALQGLRVVKTFGLEGVMRARVAESAETMKRASNELARLSNRSGPIMETLGGVAIALLFLYGSLRVIRMDATPGQFVSFIAAFLLAYEPAKRLAHVHVDIVNHLVGLRIMYQLLDSPPTEPNDSIKPLLHVAGGRVEFADVGFAYRSDEPVIRGMSFVAEPGQVTALVGQSGSGKSTAFSLILRLYDVETGKIRIDGQDIAQVSRQSVRNQIAYVGQDVFLFRGTILQNILLGDRNAKESEIIAAAKAAYAHDFIASFPQGYDTPVGEHGLQLSAGQRQRIAVARALLKNAPIVLLDEPTAALDMESEREVQRALADLCAGRTTLVIAHRLHTITAAHCIHVIENGSVVELGRHQDLLRKGKRYAAFYELLLRQEAPAQCAV